MSEIKEIYGIGEKNALLLRKNYNVRSINDLKRYVRKIPDIINDVQSTGLRFHEHISGKVTRAEAEQHIRFIQKHIPGAIACGSYRRGARQIGDIDILTTKPLRVAIAALNRTGYIRAVFSEGDEKFSGVVCLPGTSSYRRLDLVHTTAAAKPFALLYLTGDMVQNILMRKQAKKKKLVLSQHGIKHSSSHAYVEGLRTEQDIFEYLGLVYHEPTDRSHGHDFAPLAQVPAAPAAKKASAKTAKGSHKGSNKGSKKGAKKASRKRA